MYSLTNPASRQSIEDYEENVDYLERMELKARIFKARTDARLTQEELAAAIKKTRGAVSQWESGETRPKHSTLQAIAKATGKPLIWLESGIGKETIGLMVVGEVAGGIWKEGSVEYTPRGVPVAPHPEYPAESQRIYQVRGNSVNLSIKDGEYAHCVKLNGGGIELMNGDLVIVERSSHGLCEYTAKRFFIENGIKILRPESEDPVWQDDIILNGDEGVDIKITDIVIAKWSPIRRGF